MVLASHIAAEHFGNGGLDSAVAVLMVGHRISAFNFIGF
jgi:hypothetical protein